MEIRLLYNFTELLYRYGVRKAILSPGSRCAPLILAFARHPEISCYSMSDERSAAFAALGMARADRQPVVLVCTSGSAAFNYAPAVAEAFFQQIPLLLLTADRPPEWIGQLDGQTIFQNRLYGDHVKKSYSVQADLTHEDAQWHFYRLAGDATSLATEFPAGPVHLNIPFREPFYPEDEDYFADIPEKIRQTSHALSSVEGTDIPEGCREEWMDLPRKLIVPGQYKLDPELLTSLNLLCTSRHLPIAADIITNTHALEASLHHGDLFASPDASDNYDYLSPDLLITYGLSVVSKNIKTLLRQKKPKAHWHIQPAGEVADTYKSVTRVIRMHPADFFRAINHLPLDPDFVAQKQSNYNHVWQHEEARTQRFMESFFNEQSEPGEYALIREAITRLPDHSVLHLANSMAVRYANYIGLAETQSHVEVMANRGTSGIDGCSSTAVGAAIAQPDKLHVLITGDVGFFYDRNAFWHAYDLSNLRILLLNNHGGGIFRLINGPGRYEEYKEFFETQQPLTGKYLASEFNMEYMLCDRKSKMTNYLKDFYLPGNRTKLLELESDSGFNQEVLLLFKKDFRNYK